MSVHRDLNTSIKSAGNRTIAKEKLYRVMRKPDLMKGQIWERSGCQAKGAWKLGS